MHRLIPDEKPLPVIVPTDSGVDTVVNCPFCKEDLEREGHFNFKTHNLKLGEDTIISTFMFTCRVSCANPRSLQELRRSTFFLIEDVTVLPEALGEDAPKINGHYPS